jgi:membrane-bound lytic murein transglycosylase B
MAISAQILRLAALLIAADVAHMASAQETSSKLPIGEDLPPATSSAGPPANETREWNGQSGASADPLMTAEVISAAAAQFGNCIAGARHEAVQRGVTPAGF